ncbi:hypothetical protein ACOSP7_014195 [Xanthoceras sorbifolium]
MYDNTSMHYPSYFHIVPLISHLYFCPTLDPLANRRLGVWGLRFSFLDLPFLPSPVWVVLGAELGCCRAAGASFDQLSEALGAVGVRRAGLRYVTGGIGSGSSFSIYL